MNTYPQPTNNNPPKHTETEAVAEIVRDGMTPILNNIAQCDGPIIIIPKTGEVKSLEHLMMHPRRPRAAVNVQDHVSFIEYVTRHKQLGTVIFAEIAEAGGTFTAIVDYHQPVNPVIKHDSDGAQWGEHTCKYTCEFTPEWKRWRELSGKPQRQGAMALFIEDNMFDIANPEPARMLELVKTLEATQGVQFKSAIRLENGDRQLAYSVQTGAKAGEQGDMEIPQKVRLRFAIFTNGPVYDIDCRFRYNIDGGNLALAFEIVKPHKIIEAALIETQTAIKATLALPVLLGRGQVTA